MFYFRLRTWDEAYRWVCNARRHHPANADIWDLRFHWRNRAESLYRQILSGDYRLSAMQRYRQPSRESYIMWSAQDALVLKWVTLIIRSYLPVHEACTHVAGRQGRREQLSEIDAWLKQGDRYVFRTDIRGYYRHIRRESVYALVCQHVAHPVLRDLVRQYLYYSVEEGGEFYTPLSGICRGCSLSPLIGAALLWETDRRLSALKGIHYRRYMDDFLILSDRRWPVRRARELLYEHFDINEFSAHPDKTQVGKTEKGFDWLGVWFTARGAEGIAPRALENHRCRRLRLEEQLRRRGLSESAIVERVQRYEQRWNIWASGHHV
ncbi:transposase [Salmonella enterica subsp. enterica serovar Javiana]|nr:transposase [Salmonella enterica subsp. enterica serovar Javiana]